MARGKEAAEGIEPVGGSRVGGCRERRRVRGSRGGDEETERDAWLESVWLA